MDELASRSWHKSRTDDRGQRAKARSGSSGLSAYVGAAVARQVERDNLNELIQVAEAEHGPITEDEILSLRDQLR